MASHRAALVTGGASGVGAATALRLARAGLSIALVYRTREAAAASVAAAVRAMGAPCVLIRADVTSDAEMRPYCATDEAFEGNKMSNAGHLEAHV